METKDETISRLKQKFISLLHHHAEHHRLEDSEFKEKDHWEETTNGMC